MSIAVQCKCGKRFKANDGQAGKRFQCSQCGASISVPWPADTADEIDSHPVAPVLPRPFRSFSTAPPPPPDPVPSSAIVQTPQRIAPVECPDCGSDNWQRIELAYMAGTSGHTGMALFTGGGGMDVGILSGTSRTQFADSIAPPMKRTAGLGQFFGVIGGISFSVGGVVMAAKPDNALDQIPFGEIALVAGVVLIGIFLLFARNSHLYNKNKWPLLFDEWRRHFVCLKCGCVWIP